MGIIFSFRHVITMGIICSFGHVIIKLSWNIVVCFFFYAWRTGTLLKRNITRVVGPKTVEANSC